MYIIPTEQTPPSQPVYLVYLSHPCPQFHTLTHKIDTCARVQEIIPSPDTLSRLPPPRVQSETKRDNDSCNLHCYFDSALAHEIKTYEFPPDLLHTRPIQKIKNQKLQIYNTNAKKGKKNKINVKLISVKIIKIKVCGNKERINREGIEKSSIIIRGRIEKVYIKPA